MENQNEIINIEAVAVAYDPNAPIANNPILMVDGVALPPNDEEINHLLALDDIEEFIGELFDGGEISSYAYTELGGLFDLIKDNKWYKKIERRIERNNQGRVVQRLTLRQKLDHPDYKRCKDCNRVVKDLKLHKQNDICREIKTSKRISLGVAKNRDDNKKFKSPFTDGDIIINHRLLDEWITRTNWIEKHVEKAKGNQELEEEDYEN
jgi:hypothetical protein